MACRAAGPESSCSKTNATSTSTISNSSISGGGVLTLEGLSASAAGAGQRAASQCSAFVRVIGQTGRSYNAQIWTARHCIPDYSSRLLRAELSLYDGRSGYAAVDTQLPLADARNKFFDLVEKEVPAYSDSEKKQKNPARLVLDLAFLEEEGKKNYGDDCRVVAGLNAKEIPETLLCSALQDLRIFDATLTAKSKIGEKILSNLYSTQGKAESPLSKQWRENLTSLLNFELDISRGRFVDIVRNCEDTAPSVACNYKSTLQTLARKFRAPGRDLLAEAENDGFTTPGKSYADFKRQLAQAHFTEKVQPLFENIKGKIQSGSMSLVFAANFADSSGKSRVFASNPLKDFYTSKENPLQFKFFSKPESRDAFVQFLSPPAKALVLESGDSGSVLMMDASTPFLVISSKGTKSISGGASILALPVATEEDSAPTRPLVLTCKN